MSMSDCDWIIYGPDGTVTVDIGRWETYRERRLQELEFTELARKYKELNEIVMDKMARIAALEEQLDDANDALMEAEINLQELKKYDSNR